MKVSRCIAVIAAREIRRLAVAVEQRAARSPGSRAKPSFRPLTEAETAAILGGELLARVTAIERSADLDWCAWFPTV